jgi:hypothetical protein
MSKTQITVSYENLVYEYMMDGKLLNANFIDNWLRNNSTQRCYEDIGVYPTGLPCPKTNFNLWRPFAMELVTEYEPKPDKCKQILQHIKILCGKDEGVYDYFVKWIAQMIQYPAVKSICPVLISKQGAGKGSLMKLLSSMLGDRKVMETTTPSRDVWGL